MFKEGRKKKLTDITQKANAMRTKMQLMLLTVAMAAYPTTVFAGTGSTNATSTVQAVMDMVVLIFPLIGVPLVLVGAFKLFMAYRQNQPEEYSSAAKDIAIGAVMIAFQVFVWQGLRSVLF